MAPRFTILIALISVVYGTLLFHLYTLQVYQGHEYLAKAESQYTAARLLTPARGAIFLTDKNGNRVPVASEKDMPLIYAVPKVLTSPADAARAIAPLIGVSEESILAKLSKKNDGYEALLEKAGDAVANGVQSLNIKGVYVESVPERFYPFGTLASQVIGYYGPSPDGTNGGHYGIESYYDSLLSGVPGSVKTGDVAPPRDGSDVALTIDPNIQTETERILGDLIGTYHGTGGTMIVEEPKTGKILAMANVPGFDPNDYAHAPLSSFVNPALQQVYEPGSVMKLLTMSAGIDTGKITPNTTFYDTGSVTLNGKTIMNWDRKAHGTISMTYVIEKSLNTGAVFAEEKTGDAVFKSYLDKFGVGQKTGIDLPGEVKGDVRNLGAHARKIAFATASFGQGVSMTPLQLVNAVAAIANGGTLMQPYINAAGSPKAIRTVISEDTARAVTGMMQNALSKISTGPITGYSLAGKTGTAQVPDLAHGGYSDKVINTYVGFGPVKDPRFVILVKLDDPPGSPLASESVIPAFHDLSQFILNYYAVPPDNLPSPK